MSDEIDLICVREVVDDIISEKLLDIHDKLDSLLNDDTRKDQVKLSEKTLDKFDDYMKNVDKLNVMINEFKGLVAIVRGESRVYREQNQKLNKKLRDLLRILAEEEGVKE
jgi:hypothetical protein